MREIPLSNYWLDVFANQEQNYPFKELRVP